ncbi:hypothetical protein ACFLT1_03115 [Bacteroidota bacterium]
MKRVHLVFLLILAANQLIFAQSSTDSVTFQDSIPVDSYGGILSVQGTANDYFTIQQINGRYCFVTPEGHGMLAIGVSHLGAVQEVAPNNIFQTRYNSDWITYSDEAEENLRSWGFNSLSYHTNEEMYNRMPGMLACYPINNSEWRSDADFSYEDVFDPAYHTVVENYIVDMVIRAGDNKNIMGYYWNDIPQWSLDKTYEKRGTNWLIFYRELPASAPGKTVYVNFLKEQHNDDLKSVNYTYNITAATWDDVKASTFSSTDRNNATVKSEDEGFLRLIAREFYRVLGTYIKEKDPNRLILGERYFFGDHPDYVLEEQNQWVDAIAFQPGGAHIDIAEYEQMYSVVKKPIMICDHQRSFYTDEYPKTMWQQLPSQEAAGKSYKEYLNAALSKPYILGYNRCQYISREAGDVLKQGLLDINGNPYDTIVEYMTITNKELLKRFSNGTLSE